MEYSFLIRNVYMTNSRALSTTIFWLVIRSIDMDKAWFAACKWLSSSPTINMALEMLGESSFVKFIRGFRALGWALPSR
jgi:hypothetical protein